MIGQRFPWSNVAAAFDEQNGNTIAVRSIDGRITATVEPLKPGQIEELLKLSRDEIEQLRKRLLATPYSGS